MEAEKCPEYKQAVRAAVSEGLGGAIMQTQAQVEASKQEFRFDKAAEHRAEAEGMGGAIMEASQNLKLEAQQMVVGVPYEVCQQIMATSEGMPEPQVALTH